MKQLGRRMIDNGVASEAVAILRPLGAHVVECALKGELAVFSPLELLSTVQV